MDLEDRHLDTETDQNSGSVHVQLPSGARPWIQPMTQSPVEHSGGTELASDGLDSRPKTISCQPGKAIDNH